MATDIREKKLKTDSPTMRDKMQELTPQKVVEKLDQYIIGQKEAKRSIAIAFRERWRRKNADPSIRSEILPNNILMKGSTGTGKTEIARRLSKISEIPFVKVEATMYTEKGYVGRDVNEMIVTLSKRAMDMVRAEREAKIKEKASERVETMLLDIVIPPINDTQDPDAKSLNRGTRARLLEKIQQGELDDRLIEITLEEKAPNIMGGMMQETGIIAIQDLVNRMVPQRKKKRKVSLATAHKLLLRQEMEKMLEIDMENIKKEAIQRAENGIVFIDELDKICVSSNKGGGIDVSREGVQRNLLPIIEGCIVHTAIGPINTEQILFIGAGAFHSNKPSDLMPEVQGRFPVRVEFHNLDEENFYHILKIPKNSIIKQQKALLQSEEVEIHFTDKAIRAIAKAAYTINQEQEDTGARRLSTTLIGVLQEYLFDVPDKIKSGTQITIDDKIVTQKLSKLMAQKESSRYVL